MKKDVVIVGGGAAGLCAACRLVELGIQPLVIESGHYPAHKVCGEFFSPECLDQLQKWNIHPIKISQAHIRTPSQTYTFDFPSVAGSLSHIHFDPALAKYAQEKGAQLMTQTKVQALNPDHRGSYELFLSNGETIQTSQLVLATGRIPHYPVKQAKMRYMGIKAHFEGIPIKDSLEMFAFTGAYLGISPIEGQKCNVACLAKIGLMKTFGSPQRLIEGLMEQHSLLKDYFTKGSKIFADWMHVSIPGFGIKATPNWPNVYFIGDAAGTIPPACGNGLSMAVSSGILAAEYVVKQDSKGFKKAWHKRYDSQIRWGRVLHQLMLHPGLGQPLMRLSQLFPTVAQSIFHLTR